MSYHRNAVLNLIAQRFHERSAPGQRHERDTATLALAIEGGAMRGVVTAGMLVALEELGLRNVFDVVYGSSAGSSNAAYFLAGQAHHGTAIYYEHINSRCFVDITRLLHRQPIINLDFLYRHVMTDVVVLDWRAVLASPIPFKSLATSVDDATIIANDNFASRDELLDALNASGRIPFLAGWKPLLYRGHRLWDSAILDVFGLLTALRDGASHVLVLRSRLGGGLESELSPPLAYLGAVYLAFYNAKLARASLAHNRPEYSGAKLLDDYQRTLYRGRGIFQVVAPKASSALSPFETNADQLIRAKEAGRQTVLQTLGPLIGAHLHPLERAIVHS